MTAGAVHSIRRGRELVPGSPGWAYQVEPGGRGQVFRIVEDKPASEYRAVLEWCPEVTQGLMTTRPNGEVDTWYYRVTVLGQEATISHRELLGGDAWRERFRAPGLGFRTWREVLTNIVLDQAEQLPVTLAVTRTGWHTVGDGRVYVAADGRTLSGTGPDVELVGAPTELATAAAAASTPLPDGHTLADVLSTVAEHGGWAPLMGLAAGARSFGQTIRPVPAALVIWGDPNTGKTCTAAAGRLLSLAPQWPPLPTAKISEDTVTEIEVRLDVEADMPTLLDDLALTLDAPTIVQRDAVAKLERIIRAVGNGGAMRGRRRRDLTAQPQRYVRTIPVITAQSLPPGMQASLYRRAVVLRLAPGDANWRWWKHTHESGDLATVIGPGLRAIGDRIIARLGDADDPAAVLADADRAGRVALSTHVDRELPGWGESETGMVGVVEMAGAMLGGLALIADAADVDRAPLLDAVAAPLARALAQQADAMEDRRQASDDLKTAVGDIIRQALLARRAHLTGPTGTPDITHLPPGVTMQSAGLREVGPGAYEGYGVALHYVPTYGGIAVRPTGLVDLIRASGDGRAAGYTARSIGRALARAGALVPGSSRPVKRVTVGPHQPWCLVIPETVIWPDLDGDDGSDDTDRAVPQDPTPTSGPDSPTPTEPPSTLRPGQESALDVVEQLPETAAAAVAPSAPRPALTTVLAAGVSEHGVTWVGPDGAVEVVDETYESLPDLLKDVIQRMPTGGTIAVSAAAAGRLGYPDKPVNTKPGRPTKNKASKKRGCRAVVEAAEVGWQPSAAGIGAWTAWTGPDRPSVAVVVPEWCGKLGVNGETMIKADHDALAAGYLLARYRQETGVPFAMTAGTAGTNMIRAHLGGARTRGNRKARSALLKWNRTDVGLADSVHESPCVWDRPLDQISDEERAHPYVVGVDVTAAYLSAMIMSVLSWDRLEHTGIPAGGFDKHIQGYWEISQAWQPHASIPDLTGRYGSDGPRIVSTATAQLCLEHGMPEEAITDAWLPRPRTERGRNLPRSGRLLRKVGETIRDAYFSIPADTADPEERHLRATLKATFRETVGMLERGTPWVRRPDWSDTIIATARGNLLRRIIRFGEQTGRWPLRIHTDCVYYAANDSNPKQFGDIWRVAPDDRTPRLGETVIKPENVIDMNTFLATDVRGNPRR